MAYLIETDIEAELSLDIDANSTPNTTEVAGFIADIEADLNGVLYAVGVSLPLNEISHPNAWKILAQTALWGVCSRVIAAYHKGATAKVQTFCPGSLGRAGREIQYLRFKIRCKKGVTVQGV